MKYPSLIYGKDQTENIVAAEVLEDSMVLFTETPEGISHIEVPNKLWILANRNYQDKFERLTGDQHYKFAKYYTNLTKWNQARRFGQKLDTYCTANPVDINLISQGITFFKGMKLKDVSVLSFDIETDGLTHHKNSQVFLITNTYRKNDVLTRKTFDLKEFSSQGEMLTSWCDWVRSVNPSIMLGHNIYGYDIPYLLHVAGLHGVELLLGRDDSPVWLNSYESKFRKDGSQFYHYKKPNVFGRQVIDTNFLSIKYDVGRKYSSYALKSIIREEGLEKEGRTFIDAGKIKKYFNNPEEWAMVRAYAEEDSDDALKLFDLMIPSFFYITQSLPRNFETVINTSTGSQINSFLVRAYLQDGKAIPLASSTEEWVEGGISFGIPGIYKHVVKVDLKSAYPSQVLRFKLYDEKKDPDARYLQMVQYFATQRFEYKRKSVETGDPYWKDLDAVAKVFLNSAYGVMNTPGLNFNNPKIAAKITKETRDLIRMSIEWASGKPLEHWYTRNQENDGGDIQDS